MTNQSSNPTDGKMEYLPNIIGFNQDAPREISKLVTGVRGNCIFSQNLPSKYKLNRLFYHFRERRKNLRQYYRQFACN